MNSKSFLKAALLASTGFTALTVGHAQATVLVEGMAEWGNSPDIPTTPILATGVTVFSGFMGEGDQLDFLALSGLLASTTYTLTTLTALIGTTPASNSAITLCSSTTLGPAPTPPVGSTPANVALDAWLGSNCSPFTRQLITTPSGTINVGFAKTGSDVSYTVGLARNMANEGGGNAVPLPGSAALLGIGLAAAAGLRRRKHTA